MNYFKRILYFGLFIVCCFLVNSRAIAQTNRTAVDTSLFRDYQFRQVGPVRGGRVSTVAGIPGAQSSFYMGTAVGSGVWRTDNYGRSWRNVTAGKGLKSTAIGAIAVAKSDTSTIYVGTGPCGIRDIVLEGTGMYKSTDSGKHWQFIGLRQAGQICEVIVDPRNPDRIFVAALGHAFGDNPMRGIFRSLDGGKTWEKVLFISDSIGASDVEFKPGNPNVIYAGMWRGERKPWTIISGAATGDGIYKSTDGGDHWHKLTNGLPTGLVGKIDIAVTPADPSIVYALIEANHDSTGLYRSEDSGKHWTFVNDTSGIMARPFYFTDVHVDPNDPNTVYVGSVSFWKSTDGGKTFERRDVPHGDTHDLWINPHNSDIQVLATDGGAAVTVDGGRTWSTLYNQPTAELWQVNVDDRFPYWLYAGQQDRSSIVVPSLPPYPSPVGYNNYLRMMGGCETGPIVPVPDSPVVYANCKGRFGRYNRMTGQEQKYYIGARNMYGRNPKDLKFRFMRAAPIEIPPGNPGIVYMGAQYVFKSSNGGENWEKISPDLTAFKPQYQVTSGGPITRDVTGEENFSTINSIQVSPLDGDIIWTGSNDGRVYISRDKGQSWTNVTPEKLLLNSRVEAIAPSHFAEGKAYIAVRRRYLDDFHPYIYRTTDYGKHWKLLTDGSNGIPDNAATRVVREDPKEEGLLYVGTDWGLYISFDDGKHWQPFNQGLPTTAVQDIAIHANDLILATLGHGFLILDDLSVLRQVSDVNPDKNYLFKPVAAYRMHYRKHASVPQYPAPGAYIDFYLAGSSQAPIVLQITDNRGNIVRTFVGKFKKKDEIKNNNEKSCIPASLEETVLATAPCFTVHRGHNRFRWNMRYPGRTIKAVEGNTYYGVYRGPLVVPGTYTIQLSRGTWSSSRPLKVKMDPRVKKAGVTKSDLQAQLKLNLKIRNMIGRAQRLSAAVDSMRADIRARLNASSSNQPKLQQKLSSLNKIHQSLVTRDDIAYPPVMFINQSRYLYRMTTSADQRPGDFAYSRYRQLHEKLVKLRMKWKRLQ